MTPQPYVQIEHGNVPVRYYTPNEPTSWRVKTLLSKEPDTIEWIAGFAPGEVLYDVGANVGMYSIWAAKTRGTRVFAFEPESQNFAVLNANILLNGLDKHVTAYCLALAAKPGFDELYLSQFVAGGSCHNYAEPIDFKEEKLEFSFRQGCIASTVDELIAAHGFAVPAHIKIDVDGIEPLVIGGARKTLADPRVKSVLIEINTNLESHWDIIDLMLELKFDYSKDQVERAQRKEGAFTGVGNYVFRR